MCANVEGGKHNENRLDRHVASYGQKERLDLLIVLFGAGDR